MAMLPGGSGRRRRAPIADINVTPMVDVMLVLLIIFMVAAPLLVTGVAVDLPRTSAKALPADDKPISITLSADGRRHIGDETLDDAAFETRLAALFAERGKDARLVIRADSALPYGTVAAVLADVTRIGFTRVALMNQPAKAGETAGG
jgi:biopolymer transport protein TolR